MPEHVTESGDEASAIEAPGASPVRVVSALLVGLGAQRLAALLPPDRFELVTAQAGDALAATRVGAPDVVLVGDDLAPSDRVALVDAIRREPSVDLSPILLVASSVSVELSAARGEGFDDLVSVGIGKDELAEKLARAVGLVPSGRDAAIGTATLHELATKLSRELAHGLVDSATDGADERIAYGDGTELFATVWAAIARLRTSIAERAEGRVRFRDVERRGGRSFLTVGEATTTADAEAFTVPLDGRRILVADDDPAVLWFFVGLLRDAGAEVLEAPDGRVALDLARLYSPDLVLTDILMPQLDGLSLARALHRDPVLSEVPVIFLSWKDDYLQRMRELRGGAVGYLRKEEAAAVILDRVRDALRPRVRFERRLEQPGEVRGRVEGLGILSVVRSVARIRQDARITVRDVRHVFEVDLRRGQLVDVVRTSSDGSFARGRRALSTLLGSGAGRFAVLPQTSPERAGAQTLDPSAIEREAVRLGALCDAASGRGLALADHVEFDEPGVESVLSMSPPAFVEVVRRLRDNPSPRRWLLSGELEPETLAEAMAELARHGAVTAVRGENGEDLVQHFLALRGLPTGAPGPSPNSVPPEPVDEDRLEELVQLEEVAIERKANSDRPPPAAVAAADVATLATPVRIDETLRVRTTSRRSREALPRAVFATGAVLVLLGLGLGFVAYRDRASADRWSDGAADTARVSAPTSLPPSSVASARGPTDSAEAGRAASTAPGASPLPVDAELYGELVDPPVDAPRLAVGQGLLLLACPEGATVSVDGAPAVPCANTPRIVSVGRHAVTSQHGDDTRFRYVSVPEGRALRLTFR